MLSQQRKISDTSVLPDLCNKCGACCYCRLLDGTETGIKCEHLTEDNLCSTYENRPEWCMTAEQMIESGLIKHLPDTCGYKEGG